VISASTSTTSPNPVEEEVVEGGPTVVGDVEVVGVAGAVVVGATTTDGAHAVIEKIRRARNPRAGRRAIPLSKTTSSIRGDGNRHLQ
jgi:hypothetical protein